MTSAVRASLAARTGRSLEEWVALVQASGIDPLDQNSRRTVADVDDGQRRLLRIAYEQNG
jgi:hypothetical protein